MPKITGRNLTGLFFNMPITVAPQKVMLLLFIINPLIQENTNNVVKGTSNEAFCLFKIGFD